MPTRKKTFLLELEPPQLPAGQITKNGHFGRFFYILTVFSVKWRGMEHADRFLRRFYIGKGMFGSLSVTFIFYRPPLSGYSGALCLYTPSLRFVECSRDKELPRNSHKSIVGPDWPLSGALRSLPRRLTWDCVSPITISTISDKPPRSWVHI